MDAASAIRGLVGGLLIAAGVLIGLTGGVCGGFGVFWAVGYWNVRKQWDLLLLSLGGGAMSIAVGVVLFLIGRSLLRRSSRSDGSGPPAPEG